MADGAKPGGKGNKKKGRWTRKPGNVRYKANHQREKNKLKRVLQSNGYHAALEYAKKNSLHFNYAQPQGQ